MLSLEQQQLGMLAMLRGRPTELPSDPWLRSVAGSDGLKMLHHIAGWWQRFQIEAQCRYTSRLMKRLGCFAQYVDEYFNIHPTPPSIEELSLQFLSSVKENDDPLLSSVAHFELVCLGLNDKSPSAYTIIWDRDPSQVLLALENSDILPGPDPDARFVMTLSADIPGSVSCIREELAA
jgi:hypothetical protein